MKPLPSPTIAQRPSMFTPALPVASPSSASFPVRSSIGSLRQSGARIISIAGRDVKPQTLGSLKEMANRLAQETSPYLLQHKDNPVDWRPWGPDALGEAAAHDKPILLSIGYSACHWCHVM